MRPLDHVVWIGGAPGAGKTTVARVLARRHGLRIYSSDTHTWDHRDRALAAGVAAAHKWEGLSPAARMEAPVPEQAEMSLLDVRGPMVVEDLEALPRTPLVVAEGTVVPASAADPERAVWLVPTPAFQARHRTDELERWLIDHAVEQAGRHGMPVIVIDGSRPATAVAAEVGDRIGKALAAGPVAGSREERRALLRQANLDAVEQVRAGCARPWATNDWRTMVRSFACECGDVACETDVNAPAETAAGAPVLAPGHG